MAIGYFACLERTVAPVEGHSVCVKHIAAAATAHFIHKEWYPALAESL